MRKNLVKIIVIALVVVMLPLSAFATPRVVSKRLYRDVSKKTVGKTVNTAINTLGRGHAYDGAFKIKNGYFKPYKKLTRGQADKIMRNVFDVFLHVESVPVAAPQNPDKGFKIKWGLNRMTKFTKVVYGVNISWPSDDKNLNKPAQRGLFSGYLWNLVKFVRGSGFEPVI